MVSFHFHYRLRIALAAVLWLGSYASAKVLLVAHPGPGGPAGALAGGQIAHWPTIGDGIELRSDLPTDLPAGTSCVIELTEDFDFRAEMPMSDGATIRVEASPADLPRVQAAAQRAADAINTSIDVPTEKFIVDARPSAAAGVPRIVVTTSTKTEVERQRVAKRTRQLRVAAYAILAAEKAIDPAAVTPDRIAAPASEGVLRVALYDDLGARNRTAACHPVWVRQTMRDLKDLDVSLISAEDIRQGALEGQFDVLIMGGGSSRTEAATLGEVGRNRVKQFVESGGGYVGVCAGAFLAAQNSYGLGILPARSKPTGAGGLATLKLPEEVRGWSGLPAADLNVAFHGGPILVLNDDAQKHDARVWATFAADVKVEGKGASEEDDAAPANAKPAKTIPLAATPAVLSANYGKGRVVVLGPHPERAPGPQPLFWTAIRFAGGRTPDAMASAAKQSVGVVTIDSAAKP